MARIFGTAWIYIGHESQVKKARRLISRRRSGATRCDGCATPKAACAVIRNQCATRLVVATEKAQADEFYLRYHGWTYHLDAGSRPCRFTTVSAQTSRSAMPKCRCVGRAVKSYRGLSSPAKRPDGRTWKNRLGHMRRRSTK